VVPVVSDLIIGIGPGVTGALALLSDNGDLIDVMDMPSLADGTKGRSTVNAPLLAELLAKWHAREVFCEFVSSRPTDGAIQAFAFGRSRGAIEVVCGALSLPITLITPPVWKRFHDIPPGDAMKDLARSKAISKWPAMAQRFARKHDHNRAEACLIALCGLLRNGGVK
jgi:crossover junction endodeoxyribonuclease RuvC